jgi:hypothetical protein
LDAERAICETSEGIPYAIRVNYVRWDKVCVCGIGLATVRQDAKEQVPGCLASVYGAVIIRSIAVGAAKGRHEYQACSLVDRTQRRAGSALNPLDVSVINARIFDSRARTAHQAYFISWE